jgi:hypothetical protein
MAQRPGRETHLEIIEAAKAGRKVNAMSPAVTLLNIFRG